MAKRKRGNQILQREQIKTLLVYLGSNEPVPFKVALPIAERLEKYLDWEMNDIEDVLCKREKRNSKEHEKYDVGFIAACAIEQLGVSDELYKSLEILSDKGDAAIDSVVEKYFFDEDDRKVFEQVCEELKLARETNAISEGKILASRWKTAFQFYKGELKRQQKEEKPRARSKKHQKEGRIATRQG